MTQRRVEPIAEMKYEQLGLKSQHTLEDCGAIFCSVADHLLRAVNRSVQNCKNRGGQERQKFTRARQWGPGTR